jgi:tetratricopeptide (TPR) repeat protein
VGSGHPDLLTTWRIAPSTPPANWIATDFDDSSWQSSTRIQGLPQWSPRSDRAKIFHTNLWLRGSFELTNTPATNLVLRLNRSQDAEVFINGVSAGPAIDWSDSMRVIPISRAGQAALRPGRNSIALHCLDVDGGTTVGLGIYCAHEPTLGREQVLQEFDRLIATSPQRADLVAGRANLCARMGRWQPAVVDLTRGVELDSGNPDYYYQLSTVLLEIGDVPGYNRVSEQVLAKFGNTDNPQLAAKVIGICASRALDSSHFGPIKRLAERAASAPASPSGLARRQCAKGLAEYRLGNFKIALDWMEQGKATAARKDLPAWSAESQRNRITLCGLVTAMALHQLGEGRAARERLAQTVEQMLSELPQHESVDLGRAWADWLIDQQLLSEAHGLIK